MITKGVYNQLFKKSLSQKTSITYWDGKTYEYGDTNDVPVFHIKINEKISISDIMNSASLTLGEAYMDKKIEVEGSIEDLIYDVYSQAESFLNDSSFTKWLPKESHSKKQSTEDIQSHYDLGNDFYELWLDPTLTYSCAYFKTPEDTLEQAQMNKVYHTLDKLTIKPGDSLLDIGCGWGTLIIAAAKKYGAKATGITLSEEQFQKVSEQINEEGLSNQVSVELLDYRDLGNRKFDHITSIGMFEHVGKDNLEEYFQTIHNHLASKGSALIHGITGHRLDGTGRDAWINKYIFPGGYIPRISENITHIGKTKLQIIDLESLRRDYQLTLEHWVSNFHKVKDQIISNKGERFYRMWDLYLQSCAASFKAGNIDVMQYLLVHPNNNELPMHREV